MRRTLFHLLVLTGAAAIGLVIGLVLRPAPALNRGPSPVAPARSTVQTQADSFALRRRVPGWCPRATIHRWRRNWNRTSPSLRVSPDGCTGSQPSRKRLRRIFRAWRAWRMRVATQILEKDVERGLRLMNEWHIESYGPRMNGIAKWAAANPRHAAEFTLANPSGYVSRLVIETIGKEWAATDPAAALAFAAGHPGDLGSALSTAVLKLWSENKLEEAASWLARADPRTRNRLSATFVEAWAKADTSSALAWCQENLTGSTLAQSVGAVLKGAAAKDVAAAAGLVTGMNPSQSRAEAAVAVARQWFPEFSSDKPVKPETIAWLGRLDGDSVKRVLNEIHWSWVTSDPKSMATFLADASGEHVPPSAYGVLASELVRRNPSEAFEWASRLPGDQALVVGGCAITAPRAWRFSASAAENGLQNLLKIGLMRST